MKLICIGSAGGYPMGDNGTSSYLVSSTEGDYHLLLDTGSGSALALEEIFPVNELDAIWLSHDHPDHSADLGIFQHLFFLKQPAPREGKIIPIYLNEHSVLWPLMVEFNTTKPVSYQINQVLDLGPFEATMIKTTHPIECAAIRLKEKSTGKTLVYTADSGWQDSLIDFAQGADVLVADANFPSERGRNPIHMTAEEVAYLANQAQVRRLIVTHIPPQADGEKIMGQVEAVLNQEIALDRAYPKQVWEW